MLYSYIIILPSIYLYKSLRPKSCCGQKPQYIWSNSHICNKHDQILTDQWLLKCCGLWSQQIVLDFGCKSPLCIFSNIVPYGHAELYLTQTTNVIFMKTIRPISMFWHDRCFGMVNVSAQSMFRHGRFFGTVDILARSMFRPGRCFGMVDVSARSMFRCGWCFGVADIWGP